MKNFLSHLTDLCLEDCEKENQILSQKQNKRRGSKTGVTATPFAQQFLGRKSGRKITFQDQTETLPASIPTKTSKKTSDEPAPTPKTKQTAQVLALRLLHKPSHPTAATPVTFPIDYQNTLKLLRSLR